MIQGAQEKRLTTTLAWGGAIVTILVTDRVSADPVNVGKMLALSVCAGICLGMLVFGKNLFNKSFWLPKCVLLAFLLVSLISIGLSQNSWERGFYGAYGRNTGLLTYISLAIIFLAAMQIRESQNYFRIARALLIAGLLNLVYSLFASQGFEIFTWTNPYGKVLGTFGNPNFISSFMGFFIVGLFSILLIPRTSHLHRLTLGLLIVSAFYVIQETSSQQGLVVAVGGMAVAGFFKVSAGLKSLKLSISYLAAVFLAGAFSVFGMLQIGPLASILYKTSVSLRGEYWDAGLKMGLDNPFFGVGLDSYGTFYRAYRNESALTLPGVDTVTDAAHNIFIDIFSGTGFLGITLYLLIQGLVLVGCLRYLKTLDSYDPLFVFMFSIWVAYQAQAVISINQIGLAFWGWALGGALYGYTRHERSKDKSESKIAARDFYSLKSRSNVGDVPAHVVLGGFVGAALFLSIAFPSFYTDTQLRIALKENNTEKIYLAGTRFPADTNRLNFLAFKLSENGITQQAVSLVELGYSKFPKDYGILNSKFRLSPSESAEKEFFGKQLHLADPFNPAYFQYK